MVISLRQRLTFILLGLVLTVWLISVVVTALYAHKMMLRQMDEQLQSSADIVQSTLKVILEIPAVGDYFKQKIGPMTSQPIIRIPDYARADSLAVNLIFDDSFIVVGENTPQFPRSEEEGIRSISMEGKDGLHDWRVLYRHNSEVPMWLVVGMDTNKTQMIGDSFFLRTLIPLLLMLPITIIILFFGIKRGLRPLNHLAEEVASRNPLALEPIDEQNVPLEVQPVARSLNELLGRLQRALESEQRFTADAAHELQTPLAAIKTELQFYQREMAQAKDRVMIARIEKRVSRATDTVKQLLTLARLDPHQNFAKERIELRDLVTDILAELGNEIIEQDIDLQLTEGDDIWVEGNSEWLKILLRNLLTNALRYTPVKGVMEIDLVSVANKTVLKVKNDSAPISAEEFDRLADRFYRVPGAAKHGVGLGLSIVQRIAELHGAQLMLSRWHSDSGFKAEVHFNTAL